MLLAKILAHGPTRVLVSYRAIQLNNTSVLSSKWGTKENVLISAYILDVSHF